MSDKWNNEIRTNMIKVTPPSLYVPSSGIKIFLAGSIGGGNAPDWQKDVTDYIEKNWVDEDLTIYNPRKEDEFTAEMENEHAAWTMTMIDSSDYVLLHLTGDTGSPISTFELGLYIRDTKLFFSVDDSYCRKEAIEYHYNYFGVRQQYSSPNDSIDAMKANWYRRQLNG